MDFKTPQEFWNPLSDAVPVNFAGVVGTVNATVYKQIRFSKPCLLQDRANFHSFRVWQIVLVFYTVTWSAYDRVPLLGVIPSKLFAIKHNGYDRAYSWMKLNWICSYFSRWIHCWPWMMNILWFGFKLECVERLIYFHIFRGMPTTFLCL